MPGVRSEADFGVGDEPPRSWIRRRNVTHVLIGLTFTRVDDQTAHTPGIGASPARLVGYTLPDKQKAVLSRVSPPKLLNGQCLASICLFAARSDH